MSSFDIFRRLESSDDNQEALRQEVKTYKAAGAITAGDFLELDASKTGATRALYVKKCTTVATVGNGGVNASTAIGSILCGPITSGGAAGRADLATAATLGGIAVALEADTANYAAIWLFAR